MIVYLYGLSGQDPSSFIPYRGHALQNLIFNIDFDEGIRLHI